MHHLAGALAHRGGQQQLAARRELHALDRLGQRPLVGDRERADLLDLVAEELDAHGVVGGRREDVEDAAAHGELAAAGDHVDPRVREVDEGRRRCRRGRGPALRRRARSARGSARSSASGCSAARTDATMTSGCRDAGLGPVVHAPQDVRGAARRSRRSGSAARAAASPTRGTRGSRRRRGRARSTRAPTRPRGSSP